MPLFIFFWLIILVISAYDSYLSIKYQDTLYEMEQNPMGRWLMELDDGDVALFMSLKFFGTWMAVSAAILIFLYRRHLAIIASLGVCSAQIALLFYLVSG